MDACAFMCECPLKGTGHFVVSAWLVGSYVMALNTPLNRLNRLNGSQFVASLLGLASWLAGLHRLEFSMHENNGTYNVYQFEFINHC